MINWPTHLVASLAGALIRLVKVNRVTFRKMGDREFVFKERHRLSWLLILPGNLVLRWRQVPVQVLPTHQWKAWERTVTPFDHTCDETSSRALTIAKIEGVPLAQLLSHSDLQIAQKLNLVSLAAAALHGLHQQVRETSDFGRIQLSHGDATVRNAMMGLDSDTATWFDFDLRHDLNIPAPLRHADDLRALLFSAAHYFSLENLADLVHITKKTYDEGEVWHELARQLNDRWFRLDVFHFAHTRPPTPTKTKLAFGDFSHQQTTALVELIGSVSLLREP